MTLSLENHSLIYKSGLRFKGDGAYEHSTLGHPMMPTLKERSYKQDESVCKIRGIQDNSTLAHIQNKSVNTKINTTAAENCNGRLSFKAASPAGKDIGGKIMQAIAKNKLVQKFIETADKKMLVFDAAFALLINCTLRPASTMLMPTDDPEKNKKAAAHSISSGVVGYFFALALTLPLQAAFRKIKTNPQKYLSKGGQKFFKGELKFEKANQQNAQPAKNKKDIAETTEKFFARISEMTFVPIRAAMTVAFLPVVDKTIISKVFGPVKDEKKDYINPAIYFKGNESVEDEFKKFRQGKVNV